MAGKASFTVSLQRANGKRVDRNTVQNNLTPMIRRSVAGTRDGWEYKPFTIIGPTDQGGKYLYRTTITFERKPNKRDADDAKLSSEMKAILDVIREGGASTTFGQYPWMVSDSHASGFKFQSNAVAAPASTDPNHPQGDLSELVDFDKALTLEDIEVPDMLIHGTDEEIEAHPAFQGIYGRAAHIRVMFSSIKTMKDTGGMRRNHCLLHGLPGCAKSSLFKGVQTVLGPGGFLAINANSATRAGIEAIFLRRLKQTGTPPVLFIEEIEKTLEAILTVWLSIMDDRAEVRKVTHNEAQKAETRVLCFGSANDKVLFDRLMGGRPGHPGALSSRFTKPLYVPRPNRDTLKRIILRDIKLYGGNPLWADKCLDIADEVKTNDPRIVLGFLDGGERLLNDKYKEDIMTIHRLEQADKASEQVDQHEV